MKLYLLWFNEWEANNLLGIFETREEAKRWQDYFVANPVTDGVYRDMGTYYFRERKSGELKDDFILRFLIEERELGQLDKHIEIDNLKLLEWETKKREETNTQGIPKGH